MISKLTGKRGFLILRDQKIGDVVFWNLERQTHKVETLGWKPFDVFVSWIGLIRLINVRLRNLSLDFFLKETLDLFLEIQGMPFGPIEISADRLTLDCDNGFIDVDFVVCNESVWKLEKIEVK